MMMCQAYCSHGGRCTKLNLHGGLHDASGQCQWPDAESLTKAEADAVLAQTPQGREYLDTIDPMAVFLEAMVSDDE